MSRLSERTITTPPSPTTPRLAPDGSGSALAGAGGAAKSGTSRDGAPKDGLTSSEAARRLAESGPNEPVPAEARAFFTQILRRFANPLVAILIFASIASAVMRDVVNASIVLAIVVMSIAVETFQTRRSEHAAARLKAIVSQTATVRRDGAWQEIENRLVVPGDVVRVTAGDMVPADVELTSATDLHVNEAALTGESLPAEKSPESRILMGTSVVSGSGVGVVTATGAHTSFGGIAKSLTTRPPPSELERGVAHFGVLILKTVIFLVLFVIVVTTLLGRDPLESLMFAVALAVGLTPEFLPMITTVTLTRGAIRMSRAKVIVKDLATIQSFGSMDVLCSDKTGTLTTGTMTLVDHVDPLGEASERPLVYGWLNSYFESGIDNPVDTALLEKGGDEHHLADTKAKTRRIDPLDSAVLVHDHPDISGFEKVDEIPFDFERRRVSIVASRDHGEEILLVTKGAPEHVLSIATKYEAGGSTHDLDDDARARCKKTFDDLSRSGHRVLAVAWRDLAGTPRVAISGAPYDAMGAYERATPADRSIGVGGGASESIGVGGRASESIDVGGRASESIDVGGRASERLGLATSSSKDELAPNPSPSSPSAATVDTSTDAGGTHLPVYSKADEHDLTLAGFLAFVDPPRSDAREVVAKLRAEGIHVKVLTGDNELVAEHVCNEVGISTRHILTGRDVDAMSDPALAHSAEHVHVFARVSPAQKNRVLRALKGRGHVVGFLGDGINDAPSLHAADVGISVASAVDVAKEAAQIILLEPSLGALLDGVLEGRRAFGNVMKYVLMGTSSNFGNMFSMALASLLLPFLPMLPTQILLNNFLYDIAQLTIPSDHVDASFLRKPRRWNVDLIRRFMLWIGPLSSIYDLLTFYVLLKVFHAAPSLFHTGWFVESIATQTLVIFVIRTGLRPFQSRPSHALLATTLSVVAIAIALPFITPLATLLGFVPLPLGYFVFLVAATTTYLVLVEIVKRRVLRHALG